MLIFFFPSLFSNIQSDNSISFPTLPATSGFSINEHTLPTYVTGIVVEVQYNGEYP